MMQEELIKEYYWELIKWDGERIPVKPQNASVVQNKLDAGEGFIKTAIRSIAVKDIKDFVKTDRVYSDQKLIENGSRMFNEPIINTDGSIQCKWVKKAVSARIWQKNYGGGNYRRIEDHENVVVVAFRLPTHLIDFQQVTEMTPSEVSQHNLINKS